MSLCPLVFLENRPDWSSDLGASVGGVIGQVAGTQTLRGRFEEGGLLGRVLRLRASTGWGTREGTEEQLGRDAAETEFSAPMGALELGQPPDCSGGRRKGGFCTLSLSCLWGGSTNPRTPPGSDPGVSSGPGHTEPRLDGCFPAHHAGDTLSGCLSYDVEIVSGVRCC